MTTRRIFMFIFFAIVISAIVFLSKIKKSFDSGDFYQAGSGLGSVFDISKEKYKSQYLQKYADTFLRVYPHYKPTSADYATSMTSGYEFLDMTNIFFENYPMETYCVQWTGTGFISIRFAYNYEKNQAVIENTRENLTVPDNEKERMAKRFRSEVLDKMDSIISKSADSIVAIRKPPSF